MPYERINYRCVLRLRFSMWQRVTGKEQNICMQRRSAVLTEPSALSPVPCGPALPYVSCDSRAFNSANKIFNQFVIKQMRYGFHHTGNKKQLTICSYLYVRATAPQVSLKSSPDVLHNKFGSIYLLVGIYNDYSRSESTLE